MEEPDKSWGAFWTVSPVFQRNMGQSKSVFPAKANPDDMLEDLEYLFFCGAYI